MFDKFMELLKDGKIKWERTGGYSRGHIDEFTIKIAYGNSGSDPIGMADGGWFIEIHSGKERILYKDLTTKELNKINNFIDGKSSKDRFMEL